MKLILKFIKNNKSLSIGLIVSISIFISYEYTKYWPELIPNGDFYYSLLSQLSLAYMGSFIFYIIQVYIPEERNKKVINNALIDRLIFISELMIDPITQICKKCLDENFNVQNITEEQWREITKNIDFNQEVSMMWTNLKNISGLEAILENIKLVDEKINKIYMALGIYLDVEIVKLLEEIEGSSYHLCFANLNISEIENTFFARILSEYCNLHERLLKYINYRE